MFSKMAAGGSLRGCQRLALLTRLIYCNTPQGFYLLKAKAYRSYLSSLFIRNLCGIPAKDRATVTSTSTSLDSISRKSRTQKSKYLWRIRKLCENNDFSNAKDLLESFLENYWSNESLTRTLNCLLYHGVREQDHDFVHYALDKMKSCKIQRDGATYHILTLYYSENGFVDQCVELLREMQKAGVARTSRNYTPIVVAAAKTGKLEIAFKLYEEMRRERLSSVDCYTALINGVVDSRGKVLWDDKVLGILQDVRVDRLQLNMETLEAVARWFRRQSSSTWQTNWTTVNSSGVCQSCGFMLDSGKLTEAEYSLLKQHLVQLLWQNLEGQSAKCFTKIGNFIDKYSPDSKENLPYSLDEYISKTGPYDVVLDALNVGYFYGKHNFDASKLQVMIKHFLDDDKAVLVVGAPPLSLLDVTTDNGLKCGVFLIKGRCVLDDLYMLLATMHCGIDTLLVSNDMFKDHLHKLPFSIQVLLKRWLHTNRVFLTRSDEDTSKVLFKAYPSYDPIVQATGSTWHLPADASRVWLCVRKTG